LDFLINRTTVHGRMVKPC